MDEASYAAQLLAALFFGIAGVRLIRLGRRTGEAPERLLGLYFVLTGAAYLGWVLQLVLTGRPIAETADLAAWIAYSIGVVPYLLFTRLVFRPESRWAHWIVIGCVAALALSAGVLTPNGGQYAGLDDPFFWSQWLGYSVPCVWVTIEAGLSHHTAKRRERVGLGDPIVTNRYLLLALFGGFQVIACLFDIPLAVDLAADRAPSSSLNLLLAGFELAGIAALWLAFFPPATYLDWVIGPNPTADVSDAAR